jgi:hypothetical protein
MKLKIENMAPHSPVHVVWGAMVIFVIVGAKIMSAYLPLLPPCIFRTLTGIPCLTCGGTHCISALSNFELTSSFLYNPLIMISLLGLIIFSLTYLAGILFSRRLIISLTSNEKTTLRISVISLIALNWIYLIIKLK